MKRSIFTAVVLVSLLAILVTTAGVSNKSIGLAGVKFVPNKGVVLTFHTVGTFTPAELAKASIVVNHTVYGLHCAAQDDTHVDCQAPGKLTQYHGYAAKGYIAGTWFTTSLPKVTHAHDIKNK
ncbi:MAG: hypothetical protein NTW32_18835 [Chloroflexi bacterium]|nr:hypothetical protein [Chloroflexota bacterium]